MRITESGLRKVIRQVIKESQHSYVTSSQNLSDYGENLYYKLYEELQNLGYGDSKPQSLLDDCDMDLRELGQLLAQNEHVTSKINSMINSDKFASCPEVIGMVKRMM